MAFEKITEKSSNYDNLQQLSFHELCLAMNREEAKVIEAVKLATPALAAFGEVVYQKLKHGGRLFYIGSGTSGRLGVVDASELPPTFGAPEGLVVGIIAGGDGALRKAVEGAEDNSEQGWQDLTAHNITQKDVLVGLSASGTTPYVLGALNSAVSNGVLTGCITCNPGSPIINLVDFPIVAVVGPEIITGSTRLKAGTAQKMLLNMLSTGIMVKLGRVMGNRMVDMQLNNAKLIERGVRFLIEMTGVSEEEARLHLFEKKNVREAYHALKQITLTKES